MIGPELSTKAISNLSSQGITQKQIESIKTTLEGLIRDRAILSQMLGGGGFINCRLAGYSLNIINVPAGRVLTSRLAVGLKFSAEVDTNTGKVIPDYDFFLVARSAFYGSGSGKGFLLAKLSKAAPGIEFGAVGTEYSSTSYFMWRKDVGMGRLVNDPPRPRAGNERGKVLLELWKIVNDKDHPQELAFLL